MALFVAIFNGMTLLSMTKVFFFTFDLVDDCFKKRKNRSPLHTHTNINDGIFDNRRRKIAFEINAQFYLDASQFYLDAQVRIWHSTTFLLTCRFRTVDPNRMICFLQFSRESQVLGNCGQFLILKFNSNQWKFIEKPFQPIFATYFSISQAYCTN